MTSKGALFLSQRLSAEHQDISFWYTQNLHLVDINFDAEDF